jgi:hypothetical protein
MLDMRSIHKSIMNHLFTRCYWYGGTTNPIFNFFLFAD